MTDEEIKKEIYEILVDYKLGRINTKMATSLIWNLKIKRDITRGAN